MQILEDFKIKRLSRLHQILLLDERGFVRDSCDALFPTTPLRTQSAFKWFPLLESIFPSLLQMTLDDPELRVAKVERPAAFLPGFYDFTFSKVNFRGKELILWTILDFTKPYEDFLAYQQRRNEFEIHLQTIANLEKPAKADQALKFYHQEGLYLSYFNIIVDILKSPVNILDSISISLDSGLEGNGMDYLGKLNVSMDFIRNIIAEFEVFYQHIPAKYHTPIHQDFEVQTLVKQIVEKAGKGRKGKSENLSLTFDPLVPDILCGYPARFAQVLYYLISNREKFDKSTHTLIHFTYKTKPDDPESGEIQLTYVERFIDKKELEEGRHQKKVRDGGLVFRTFLIKKLVELQDGHILASINEDADQVTVSCTLPMKKIPA